MAEAAGGEAQRPLSPRIHGYARDLLRRFSGNYRPEDDSPGASSAVAATEEDSGVIELSLGLSLGGFFGADPDTKRGLVRSSSVASLPFLQRAERDPVAVPVITRTCSLPVEIEEEQRKRRELQCLRRMEAKRKRSEKRNSHRWGARDRPAGAAAAPAEKDYAGGEDMQQGGNGDSVKAEAEHPKACPGGPNGVSAAAAPGAAAVAVEGMRIFAPASHGSVGSQGSNLSGVSDYSSDARPLSRQGTGVAAGIVDGTKPRSQSTVIGEPTSYRRNGEAEDAYKKKGEGGRNGMWNMMEEMPCVSTRGGGPNGKRVEGFLYRCRKGEEVRIVCVCHGSFFSPAEFVKHAGGGEVAHPLRHIVVSPSPSSFL